MRLLRSTKKPVMLVANKVDDVRQEADAASLASLSTEELDLTVRFLSRNMREAAQGSGESGKATLPLRRRAHQSQARPLRN